MTDRRSIPELRAHADKVPGYGHLVAHEMVDEIEELRAIAISVDRLLADRDELRARITASEIKPTDEILDVEVVVGGNNIRVTGKAER